MREIVYSDEMISIVKDTFHDVSSKYGISLHGVKNGTVRYWLYNADGSQQFYHDEDSKNEGYLSISEPSEGVVAVEFYSNCFYLIDVFGKLLTPRSFYSVSSFLNGFAKVSFSKLYETNLIDHSGRLFLKLKDGKLLQLPVDCYGGVLIDDNHIGLAQGEYLGLCDGLLQPIMAMQRGQNSVLQIKSWEKGPNDWCIYITVPDKTYGSTYHRYLFNLYRNMICSASNVYLMDSVEREGYTFSPIGSDCIHSTEVVDTEKNIWDSDEREYYLSKSNYIIETVFFKSGQSYRDNCKIEVLADKHLILIHGGNYVDNNIERTSHCGCFSFEGNIIVPIIYSDIKYCNNGFEVVFDDNIFTYSIDGSLIYKGITLPKGIHAYSELGDGILQVMQSVDDWRNPFLYGVFAINRMDYITPMEYSVIRKCYNDYMVCKEDKYGLLNDSFKELIPCQYHSLVDVKQDLFICSVMEDKFSERFGIINRTGKYLIEPHFYKIYLQDEDLICVESYRNRTIKTTIDFNLDTVVKRDSVDESSLKLKGFWNLIDGFWEGSDYCSFIDEEDKWGIVNVDSTVVTRNKYDSIETSGVNGVYIGRLNDSIYFLNPGKRIEKRIDCESYWAREESYKSGLLYVSKQSGIGLLNSDGDLILECIYSEIWIKEDHILLTRGSLHGKADLFGNIIVPCEYSRFDMIKNGYYIAHRDYALLLSPQGYPVISQKDGYSDISETDGNCLLCIRKNEGGEAKYGLLSPTGKIRQKPELSYIGKYDNGEAIAIQGGKRKKWYDETTNRDRLSIIDGKYGVLDVNGNYILEPKYDSVGRENGGLRPVALNISTRDKYGVIDNAGKMILDYKYDFIRRVVDDFVVFAVGGEWQNQGFIKEKLPVPLFKDYAYLVGAKWGIISVDGKIIIEPFADFMNDISEDKVTFRIKDKYGVIDLKTKTKHLTDYNYLSCFHDGRCISGRFDNRILKFGFIKDDYSELVPCEYDKAYSFDKGEAVLVKGRAYYDVDKDGRVTFDYSDYEPADVGIDWERETWYYLTGGQYGDYPGPGVDYDFLGL